MILNEVCLFIMSNIKKSVTSAMQIAKVQKQKNGSKQATG